MSTNINYWEKDLQTPTPAFRELFLVERAYLLEKISEGSKVLDIGCGEGRNMRTILEKTKNVYGVDNDAGAVLDAKKHFSGINTVVILQADATNLPFENNFFDTVILFDVFHNFDTAKEKALVEITRVLKNEGTFLLSTYSEDSFLERMKLYASLNLPILKTEETKVFFDGNVFSEQFSKDEIETFGKSAGLKMTDCRKVGYLDYLCAFCKN